MKSFLSRYHHGPVTLILGSFVFVFSLSLMVYIAGATGFLIATATSFLFAVCCMIFFAMFTTDFVTDNTMILGPENQILRVIERGRASWRWDPIWASGKRVSYNCDRLCFRMKLDPLTENPKVRHLQYWVDISTKGTPEDAKSFVLRFAQDSPNTYLKSLLFDFNEAESKELAKLYNPLNEEQQKQFSTLLDSYLAPHLAGTGMRLQSARFDDALNSIHN